MKNKLNEMKKPIQIVQKCHHGVRCLPPAVTMVMSQRGLYLFSMATSPTGHPLRSTFGFRYCRDSSGCEHDKPAGSPAWRSLQAV